jgi:hypothetical protein
MKWRIVGLETHDAYFNMGLDEAKNKGQNYDKTQMVNS